jgi:hypothetical protein
MTDFCRNCNNDLKITRTIPTVIAPNENPDIGNELDQLEKGTKENLNTATPNYLSDTDDDNDDNDNDNIKDETKYESGNESGNESENEERDAEVEDFYENILKTVEREETLTEDQVANIDIKRMIKTDYYKSLKSKSDIKKKILTLIEDMSNSDENTNFYLFCTNCGYNRPLDTGFHIMSKNPEGVASIHDYSDDSSTRNDIHTGIYPRTREFKCPNDKCESNHGKPTEACMMRDGDTYKMVYVCTTCLTIKRL